MRPVPCILAVLVCVSTLASLAGCAPTQAPLALPPEPVIVEHGPDVDPEIDHWFRSEKPGPAFRLAAGDQIKIEIQGSPEFTVVRPVPPDGAVPLFMGGSQESRPVNALGRTPAELEKDVKAAYASQLPHAYVTVTVVEAVKRFIYVSGAVASPNKYELDLASGGITVNQAVTMAGGPTGDADLSAVTVMRFHPGRKVKVASGGLDIQRVLETGDSFDDLPLLPGDTVIVPTSKGRTVHVLGFVESPGEVRWYEGLTVAAAITKCGGFKRFAKVSAISVIRGGQTFYFDFDAVIDNRAEDLPLAPGDTISVPEKFL